MQTLTKERLEKLDNNGFCVFYIGEHFALVRKWSKINQHFRGKLPLYVLVKIKKD